MLCYALCYAILYVMRNIFEKQNVFYNITLSCEMNDINVTRYVEKIFSSSRFDICLHTYFKIRKLLFNQL